MNAMAKVQMWGKRLLVKPIGEVVEQTAGGLWLPQQALDRQRYRQYEIVAVGNEVEEQMLQPGLDVVLNQPFPGEPVLLDGTEYRVIFEDHVIAFLTVEEED